MGIKRVRIWSENASNYHNSALVASMASMKEKTGVEVVSYSFFEKQAGKSHADRGIGLGKRKMLSFRDAMHDVITAEQMFEALNATKQLRGFSIYLSTGVEVKTISTTKIPGIKKLGHFHFHGKSSAIVWRFRGIGDGEHIHNLHATEAELKISKEGGKLATAINLQDRKRIKDADKKPYGTYDEPTFWILPHERAPVDDVEPNDVDDDIVNPSRPNPYSPAGASKPSLFYCHCGASFIRHSNFLKHLTSQAHKIRPDKIRLMDRVLGLFTRAIENLLTPVGFAPVSEVLKKFMEKPEPELEMGWALSNVKKRGRYPETTKAFVKKLFDEYASKGHKLKAAEAERMMRADPQILPSEWMDKPQLKNYINTLVANLPKLRVYRNVLEQAKKEEEEEEHESKDEMKVIPLADEDIFITEEDFHAHLSKTTLKKFFSDVDKPVTPNTPVPKGAIEFD